MECIFCKIIQKKAPAKRGRGQTSKKRLVTQIEQEVIRAQPGRVAIRCDRCLSSRLDRRIGTTRFAGLVCPGQGFVSWRPELLTSARARRPRAAALLELDVVEDAAPVRAGTQRFGDRHPSSRRLPIALEYAQAPKVGRCDEQAAERAGLERRIERHVGHAHTGVAGRLDELAAATANEDRLAGRERSNVDDFDSFRPVGWNVRIVPGGCRRCWSLRFHR